MLEYEENVRKSMGKIFHNMREQVRQRTPWPALHLLASVALPQHPERSCIFTQSDTSSGQLRA